MNQENIHYRLPLRLINSYTWAELIKPAKAILPVIGVHANKNGEAWPRRKLISELSGYSNLNFVDKGINDLIEKNLIIKKKEGRHNIYYLTDLAIWKPGRSYFPIYKMGMILSRRWADLTPSEKSIYPVFGNKGSIKNPDVEGSEFHCAGDIYKIKKYCEWAGISQGGFDNICIGLNHKNLVEFEEEGSVRYWVYVPQ